MANENSDSSNTNNQPSAEVFAEMLKELKALNESMSKPTKMMEMNPFMILNINGEIEIHRQMTNQRIGVPPSGDRIIIYTIPLMRGPTGFQAPKVREVTLYMTLEQFKKEINGDVFVDLRKYGTPPLTPAGQAAKAKFGNIGTRQKDGTLYAGLSPENGRPMFVEPYDEGNRKKALKYIFMAAQGRANQRSKETGQEYFIPTERELVAIVERLGRARADGGNFELPMFDPANSTYWTSSRRPNGSKVAIDYRGRHARTFPASGVRRYHVRLAHH